VHSEQPEFSAFLLPYSVLQYLKCTVNNISAAASVIFQSHTLHAPHVHVQVYWPFFT